MRDYMGNHVSQVDKHGYAVGVDAIRMSTSVWGSFRVRYAESVDKVCVEVEDEHPGRGRMSMQLTLEQAMLLRDLVDAGIADALAAQAITEPVSVAPEHDSATDAGAVA
ncbi:hypothetical protein [Nocardia sp. NPDC059239]|uniref:hypothetical protein n=1 Tax=unclassified Nocardia TaxID=2637762 RepID=UPI0036C2CDA4